jgi:hypothetical protein
VPRIVRESCDVAVDITEYNANDGFDTALEAK